MTKKCSVEGCTSSAKRTFKFPDAHEKERILKWLAATGNASLLSLSTESLRNRTVCIDHFESKFILAKRLATTAVPNLHLPGQLDVSSYKIQDRKKDIPRKSRWKARSSIPVEIEATLLQEQSENNAIQPHEVEGVQILKNVSYNFQNSQKTAEQSEDAANDSNAISLFTPNDINNNGDVVVEGENNPDRQANTGVKRKPESDDSTVSKKRVRGNYGSKEGTLLSFFNLSRKAQMSPKEKHLYNVIARLRKSLRETQKHKVSLRARLNHVQKFVQDGVYESLADLPEASRNFLISYFRNVRRDKYHRQYTIKDKVFALALYKRSTGAYRFLQEILTLPSIETLRKLINRIPIEPGLCDYIFEALSDKISRLKDKRSRYCILAFDETSLEPTLCYNASTGSIDGFVDTGYERKAVIANHAMVWMLKSV